MIGFAMYQLEAGTGFILRLMIDEKHQRKGYGKAAMTEVIRRLKLCPEVEIIATSHRDNNDGAAALYRQLGFKPWSIEWAEEDEGETYLVLDER
jgi:diamine N-acetyltransferase